MAAFEKVIQVGPDDLDQLQHVNNVRYVQWVQDVAQAHWQALAPKEILGQVVWVLLRHHLHYKSQAVLHDHIRIRTYVSSTDGVKSTRIVEMFNNKNDQLLLHSETEWCLLNGKSLRPMRISDTIKELFSQSTPLSP
ncbi:thioesterase family protein [Flavobacteriaceae bacterium 3-367]|uniref:acyl-CoA thioesterase n=1 Tax=Eudoraea algarum TaxID=3417568 RepID=UPI00327DF80F